MINRIDRYIARNLLMGTSLVMLLLLALFSFLALAEELEDVGQATYRTIDAFVVVALTLPKRLVELLPVTLLIGGLIGLGSMANQLELVALRASGFSPRRIAWPALQVGLIAAAVVVALQNFGIPVWEEHASRIRAKAIAAVPEQVDDSAFWTRTGNSVLHVNQVLFGRSPTDIEIYQLDSAGNLDGLIEAGRADLIENDMWLLRDVRVNDLSDAGTAESVLETLSWKSELSPNQISRLLTPIEALAPRDLIRYINYLRDNRLDTHQYQLTLWQQVGVPIGILAMCLLGVPFVLGSTRSMSAGQRVAIGGSVGIVFYLIEQVTGQVATLFQLNPVFAALVPDAILLSIAVVLLSRLR